MNDRELLELAAKAAGIKGEWLGAEFGLYLGTNGNGYASWPVHWNPLAKDGDALRLATKLRIDIAFTDDAPDVYAHGQEMPWLADKDARRAIVRAAAEIGKQSNAALSGRGPTTIQETSKPLPAVRLNA